MAIENIEQIIEVLLFLADEPLTIARLKSLLSEQLEIDTETIKHHLANIENSLSQRGVELVCVASGYRIQTRQAYADWVNRLYQLKPTKYSRAFLETVSIIAYRQPITRAEIEDVRGVAASSHVIRSLQERGWIKVSGHRDVPGRPELLVTTKGFLDYFNLTSLDQLPKLGSDVTVMPLEAPLAEQLSLEGSDLNIEESQL